MFLVPSFLALNSRFVAVFRKLPYVVWLKLVVKLVTDLSFFFILENLPPLFTKDILLKEAGDINYGFF
jgi:hypothetical protein